MKTTKREQINIHVKQIKQKENKKMRVNSEDREKCEKILENN